MNLDDEIKKIETDWNNIILKWTKDNPIKWSDLCCYIEKSKNDNNNLEIFPSLNNIFRCFKYFNSNNTRVVILGQDPYHGKNQATGLCFGVSNNVKKPPSLKNIEKELIKQYNITITDQTLENWAKQGVLLLNTSLTVIEKNPGSHLKYWNHFTKFIIDYINKSCDKIVFVAWGAFAHKKMLHVDKSKHNLRAKKHYF